MKHSTVQEDGSTSLARLVLVLVSVQHGWVITETTH